MSDDQTHQSDLGYRPAALTEYQDLRSVSLHVTAYVDTFECASARNIIGCINYLYRAGGDFSWRNI